MRIFKPISSSVKIYLNNAETANVFTKGRKNKIMKKIVNTDKIASTAIYSSRKMILIIMNKMIVKKD